jgi:multidrug efflux pump subunit AcrB
VPGELSNVATFTRDSVPGSANQANIQPVYEVYVSTQGRDLGGIASDIDKVTADLEKKLTPGNTIEVTGQIQSMNQAFWDMTIGLLFAAVFVYLLMVVNYQNFGDPSSSSYWHCRRPSAASSRSFILPIRPSACRP